MQSKRRKPRPAAAKLAARLSAAHARRNAELVAASKQPRSTRGKLRRAKRAQMNHVVTRNRWLTQRVIELNELNTNEINVRSVVESNDVLGEARAIQIVTELHERPVNS